MKAGPPATDARSGPRVGWREVAWLLLLVAVAVRINNALRFKTRLGFDAVENVQYIQHLLVSWQLPAPDAAWATSHPPLFYYASAALGRLLGLFGAQTWLVEVIPLVGGALGIATALLAADWVLREDPAAKGRAVIALGLLLCLPVHVYMSAMVSEEMWAALLTSGVLVCGMLVAQAIEGDADPQAMAPLPMAAIAGLLAGLALLTKLSAVLVVAAVGLAWLIVGARTRQLAQALRVGAVFGLVALVVGGWFYARNFLVYGYLYPQDLAVHRLMFDMPPGVRHVTDYFYVPLSTFTNPQLLDPDLLHSVWGSTYATLYFDGHRHFLSHAVDVARMGSALLVLGLLPCAAFVVGLAGGVRRAVSETSGPDTAMVLLVVLTLSGYVAFTWGNPWFATLKGSYLLGLSIPFAYYASGVLAEWGARPGVLGIGVWVILALLAVLVVVTFTFGPVFVKLDGAGLPWQTLSPPR